MGLTRQHYLTHLQALLPWGPAWSRAPGAWLTRLLDGFAEELARVDGRASDLAIEANPRTTLELLEDWERATGLPDPCTGELEPTLQGRRAAVVAKLAATGGQSIPYFLEVAAALGYPDAVIDEFPAFVVDGSSVEEALNDHPDWVHTWRITAGSTSIIEFSVEQSTVGEPLVAFGDALFQCRFNALKPAHTILLFAYLEAFEPETLFLAGEAGAIYDHRILANFYSDAAMTTQAVLNGPVGAIRDSSPNSNHRRQVTATARPTLRGTPIGPSLVTNGDFAAGLASWSTSVTAPGSATLSGGGVALANGTTGSATLRQQFAVPAGSFLVRFKVSGWLGPTSPQPVLKIGSTADGDTTYGQLSINGDGDVVRYVDGVAAGLLGLSFEFPAAAQSGAMTIDDVQVFDLAEGSVGAPYGVQYDGVDDFLVTDPINFTGSGGIFACFGRAMLGTLNGVVAELSPNVALNAGSFLMLVNGSGASIIAARGTGTFGQVTGAPAVGQRPYMAVHTALVDLSKPTLAEEIVQRTNGEVDFLFQSGTNDDETGNLGNYPVYFGARGGAGLRMFGIDYGGVIRGGTLPTDIEVGQVEAWVNDRTGAF